jgi:hypothetical protein
MRQQRENIIFYLLDKNEELLETIRQRLIDG